MEDISTLKKTRLLAFKKTRQDIKNSVVPKPPDIKYYDKTKALAPIRDTTKNSKLEEHGSTEDTNPVYRTVLSAVEEEIQCINSLADKG